MTLAKRNTDRLEPVAHLKRLLLFLFIALTPLQDTALAATPLKGFAASPAVFPLTALLLLWMIERLLRQQFRVPKWPLAAAIYVLLVCMWGLLAFPAVPSAAAKSLMTHTVQLGLLLFVVFGMRYGDRRTIQSGLLVAFSITLVGIVTDWNASAGISLLRVTQSAGGKLRGFCTEGSTLSVQIVTVGALCAHYLSRGLVRWIVGLGSCTLMIFSDSKGGLIAVLLCGVVLLILQVRGPWLAKLALPCALLPALWLGSSAVLDQFVKIIDTGTSETIATRGSMAGYAVVTVLHQPFGVGFSGFLPSIPRYLPPAEEVVQDLFPVPLAFAEVNSYLYPPQRDADCKTFLFDMVAFLGLPAGWVIVRFLWRHLRSLLRYRHSWLFIGTLFSAVAMSTYYSSMNVYSIPLLLGVGLWEAKHNEDSVRL